MKTKTNLIVIAALMLMSLNACKEDTKDPEPAKTKTDYLTASPWIATALTVDPAIDVSGTKVTDWYSQMDPCEKDDLVKYESNKTGVYDEGATKCDPSDPQSDPFIWTFDLSETKLTEDGETMDLIQLDASILKYSATYKGEDIGGTPGLNYTMTGTFKHK